MFNIYIEDYLVNIYIYCVSFMYYEPYYDNKYKKSLLLLFYYKLILN